MKRFSVSSLVMAAGLALAAMNAHATITWSLNYSDGTPIITASPGSTIGTINASADGGWFSNSWIDYRASGSCTLSGSGCGSTTACDYDSGTSGFGNSNISGSATIKYVAGGLTKCTVTATTNDDSTQTRSWPIRQTVSLNVPVAKNDVDPDYTITASATTTDGVSNTINSVNKLTFSSLSPTICTIVSQDVNSAVIHNTGDTSSKCKIKVVAAGDTNISASGAEDTEEWDIINTQGPQLTLVSPLTQGIRPSFVFHSTKPGTITISTNGGTSWSDLCVDATAEIGNNTCTLNSDRTVGTTYSNYIVKVTDGSLSGTLDLPAFTVTENVGGPGGVGAVDNSTNSTVQLWLNGSNLPASGAISTWSDLSGRNRHFGGGVSPTAGNMLNGFKVATFNGTTQYLTRASTDLNARSLFVVYNDSGIAGFSTPFSSTAWGLMHGFDNQTQTFSAAWTNSITLNGTHFANGTAFNPLTTARPNTYQIRSHVFQSNYSGSTTWYVGRDQCCDPRSITGGIAEFMVYSDAVNNARRIIIENYLSAKYNLALTSNGVYPYGGAALYRNDVAGIGQASDGSNHVNARGAQIQVSNPVGLDNGEFLLWGHDNDDLAMQLNDVPALVPQRLTRRWRFSNRNVSGGTNGITGVDLRFHVSELPGFLNMCFDFRNIVLLVDGDGSFASGATVVSGGVFNANTNTVTWSNVSIPDGSYVTFGVGGDGASVFVKPAATGKKDGSSWANACTLQSALTSPRLIGDTIKLSAGIHRPGSELTIKTPMTIQGGYAGVSDSESPDSDVYQSIVTGDLDFDDQLIGNVVLYHRNIRGTNLARLFYITNVTNPAAPVILDGFTVTGMSQLLNHGAAVWQQNARVNYNKMRFFGNRAREMGGALFVNDGSVATITNSYFVGNVAEHGGAIEAKNGSTVTATNTSFVNNQALLLANRSNPSAINVGKAMSVNGYNNVVTTSSATPTNTFTIEAWVKSDNLPHQIDAQNNTSTEGTSGQRYLFFPTYRDDVAPTPRQGGVDHDNDECISNWSGMGFSVGTGSAATTPGNGGGISVYEHAPCYMPALAVYSAAIAANQWYHIAIVYNNRQPTIYLNGTAVHTGVTSAKATVYAPYEMGLGGYGGFSGLVDEIRLWNVARSAAQIQANMYNEIPNPTTVANLVGYWQLNDNVLDSSASANHGVLSAASPTYVNGSIPSGSATGWNRFKGGAIDLNSGSKLTVNNSLFDGNTVTNSDGAATIRGMGGAISLGENEAPTETAAVRAASNKAELTVNNTVFTANSARDGGGAIYAMPGFKSIAIDDSTFDKNAATRVLTGGTYWGNGAAIYALGSPTAGFGTITISDTEFTSNTAAELGGALFFSGNYPDADSNNYLTVNIDRSSFVGNKGSHGGAFFSWQFGTPTNHSMTVNNSTFTENSAVGYGGALGIVNASKVTINHSTIYKNAVTGGGGTGGGIRVRDANTALTLKNSIVVDNTAASGKNIYNSLALTAATYNLIGYAANPNAAGSAGWYNTSAEVANASSVGTGNLTGAVDNINKILNLTLATNGGVTRNFMLSSNGGLGSPAFNKIPVASCLSQDQRAVSRLGFTNCDMGSYETSKVDTDADGKVDAIDNCPTAANAAQEDLDADSLGDICDDDKDGDGVANASDYFPSISLYAGGVNRADIDHDGIPDVCDSTCQNTYLMFEDTDRDNDTVANTVDNCPAVANTDQSDIDNDGVGDACDNDMDGDGFQNTSDNCPSINNPLQTDSDGNGVGDDCNALFVKPVGTGLGDCSSWQNACGGNGAQLNTVIANAAATQSVIYLAKGIYKPTTEITLLAGTTIYGGFKGEDELYFYQAKPETNLTIISGDKDSNDAVDGDGITRAYANQSGTNQATLFALNTSGTAANKVATLDGLVITGAGSTSALYDVSASRLRLNDVKFYGNKGARGGAVRLEQGSKLVVTATDFSGNQATAAAGGGALYFAGAGEVTMANVNLTANHALAATATGGAVVVTGDAKLAITQAAVMENQAAESGGAIMFNATGSAGSSSLSVVGSTFSGNRTTTATASKGGAAIYMQGNIGIENYIGTTQFLQNSSAQRGGALMFWNTNAADKKVVIEDAYFKANTATNVGGAISVGNSSGNNNIVISRGNFVSNMATVGGAIHLEGTASNQLAVDNTTFYDNRASTNTGGGALYMTGGADAALTHVTVLANYANSGAGNGGGVRIDNAASQLTLKNSLVIDNRGSAAEGSNIGITASGTSMTDSGYNLIGFGAASGLKYGGTQNKNPAEINATSKVATATTLEELIDPALKDYGGLYKSIALAATSQARDAIPNGINGCVTGSGYDERGFERPDMVDVTDPDQEGNVRHCDIGAFEFNNAYRLDCFPEDGLRPDQGSGNGVYFCDDGGTTSPGELANNIFVGSASYWLLGMLAMTGLFRRRLQGRLLAGLMTK